MTTLLNKCELALELQLTGPTLIAGSRGTIAKRGRNDAVVLRFVRDGTGRVFIPASTIKGMLRHHAERICRMIESMPIPLCCDPLGGPSGEGFHQPCHERLADLDPRQRYHYSCPVCRLFGSRGMQGRISTEDAYLQFDPSVTSGTLTARGGMSQDRFTGAGLPATGNRLECLSSGVFETVVSLENYELWQLGLLYRVIESLQAGNLRIGRRRSRGMGGITGKITELRFVRCGTEGFKGKEFDYTIEGIGAVYRGADHSAYGFETDGVISNVRAFTPTRAEEKGLRHRVLIRRASTMEWFLGETARRWMHLKAGAINGFAARALTLREKAVTLRGKEA